MKKEVLVFLFLFALVPFLSVMVSAGIGAEAGQTAFSANVVPGIIEAENFDNGGDGKAYYDTTGNESGSNRTYRNEKVDLNSFNDASNKLSVGWTKKGEWLDYTINVTETGVYEIDFNTSHANSNQAQVYFLIDGANVTSLVNLPNTGNWATFRNTRASQKFYLTQGIHVLTVYLAKEGNGWIGNLDYFNLTRVSEGSNCNVLMFPTFIYNATHNTLGIRKLNSAGTNYNGSEVDTRFLCYSGRLYECGWELTNSLSAHKMSNKEVIAGWMCDLSTNLSSYIGVPIFTRPSSAILNYNQTYSGFELYNSNSFNGAYGVVWKYTFYDGSSSNETQYFGPGVNSNNFVSFSKSFVSPASSGKVLSNVSAFVFFNSSKPYVSSTPEVTYSINYTSCSNECNLSNEQQCSGGGDSTYRTCGNYDVDVCFEWSTSLASCGGGMFCNMGSGNLTNRCSVRGSSNCLLSEGRFCSTNTTILGGFNYTSGNCGSVGSTCFECNNSAGYTLDSATNSSCKISNCPVGQHMYNNVCVSNSCGGVAPSGTNFSNGSAIYTFGNLSWTHVYGKNQSELTACQWSCASGFKPNATAGNSCEVGKPVCSLFSGNCTNSSLSLGNFTNISSWGSCAVATDSCIKCNVGYSFNGSQCVYTGVIPGSCGAGKCYYNNSCLPDKFRISNATGKFYCNSTSFVAQKTVNATCSKDYECIDNFCGPEGKCINLVNEVGAFRTWFKQLRCWILSGFNAGSISYTACMGP